MAGVCRELFSEVPPTTGPRAFETVPMMQPPPQEAGLLAAIPCRHDSNAPTASKASATPSWHYEQQMRLEQLLSQLMPAAEKYRTCALRVSKLSEGLVLDAPRQQGEGGAAGAGSSSFPPGP